MQKTLFAPCFPTPSPRVFEGSIAQGYWLGYANGNDITPMKGGGAEKPAKSYADHATDRSFRPQALTARTLG